MNNLHDPISDSRGGQKVLHISLQLSLLPDEEDGEHMDGLPYPPPPLTSSLLGHCWEEPSFPHAIITSSSTTCETLWPVAQGEQSYIYI
ncbi:hypothetical protein E2C01_064688 [Portunus trituberculatus]|uniref:Uncharacterized protein n=1 Tax=Portunus trituberculatus TaxID=210409 RepID=A0A5B7HL13_PORTR|nr:hypothetical protein [Portunus trituberculatus]